MGLSRCCITPNIHSTNLPGELSPPAMHPGTGLERQLQRLTLPEQSVRLLENGLLDLSETPKHLVEVARRNVIESHLLRLPAEIRCRIFEFALSGYDIKIGYGAANARQPVLSGLRIPLRKTLEICVEFKLGDGKKRIVTDCKTSSFYLPQVCRMVYSETVTKGYALNGLFIDAATFIELPLRLLGVGVWAKSLATAQFDAISRITIPAQAYVPYLGYSYLRGRPSVSGKFPYLKYIYACGGYPLVAFASWVRAKKLAIRKPSTLIQEAQVRGRYAGWIRDQLVGLIRQICFEIEGKHVEIIIDGSPTDLYFFNQN
ncbi:hypothetical protein PMIN07_011887 [Paraphaeosphaeria minitans]